MAVTKDITSIKIQAEPEYYVEHLRIQREEGQYAMHKQTQTQNIGAFQVENQAEVGIAGAKALGQMGANGAGDINFDGNGEGFTMTAMMASMAVGGAVGQNISGSMNTMMSGINQPIQNAMTPPPLSNVQYHVAVNDQAIGPFDLNILSQMVVQGTLTKDTLVWTQGMANWAQAGTIDESKHLFQNAVLPIPPAL